jgi:hypothetical protein
LSHFYYYCPIILTKITFTIYCIYSF